MHILLNSLVMAGKSVDNSSEIKIRGSTNLEKIANKFAVTTLYCKKFLEGHSLHEYRALSFQITVYFILFNFLNIILIMLLQLSHVFLLCSHSLKHPLLPHTNHTLLFMFMDHAYKFFGYSTSYSVLYIPMAIL